MWGKNIRDRFTGKSLIYPRKQRSETWRLVFAHNDFDLPYHCWQWVISQCDKHGECPSKRDVALMRKKSALCRRHQPQSAAVGELHVPQTVCRMEKRPGPQMVQGIQWTGNKAFQSPTWIETENFEIKHRQWYGSSQREEGSGISRGQRGSNIWWQKIWICLVGTQCNMQVMYRRNVHLKPIYLLTNISPINLVLKGIEPN